MGVMRRYRALRARLLGRVDPIVLMYHRVADLPCDPWKLAVTPAHFAEQIACLARRRTIVPMEWLLDRLEAKRVPERAVVVTFDDGYADTLVHAKPILERAGAPATVYLTSGVIGRRREFWWDRLARLLLEAPSLPETLELAIAGRAHAWPSRDRAPFHLAVWETIRILDEPTREAALTAIEQWATAAPPARPLDRALDPDEVRALAAGDLIAIGAHSISHASLPTLAEAERRREMTTSRDACADLVGRPVTGFAFPFGDCDRATERSAAACGFRHAVTTEPGTAVSYRDRFRLPRLFVDDWSAEELERNLLGAG